MLIDMTTEKPITKMPYAAQYKRYMSALSPQEIAAIKTQLNSMIDGTEIQTSSWMPGHDWIGTDFEPIYFKAAKQSYESSAKCFGLMVWEVFMERRESWTSGRFEKDGEPLRGRTYFQPGASRARTTSLTDMQLPSEL